MTIGPRISNSDVQIILADSITHVSEEEKIPRVVICGSHGGIASGIFALRKHLQGVIFNDAGGGKNQAGIAALPLLDKFNIYAATVDAFSARIGLAEETGKGIISHANSSAINAGIRPGMGSREAAEIMKKAPLVHLSWPLTLDDYHEQLTIIYSSSAGYRIVAMDSNSMVTPENKKDIIMTGSHGALVGEAPAVKYPVVAAFYNDAGVGKDQAGISRLPWLEKAGIIAATVDAATAKIGLGLDTYQNGIISYSNFLAQKMGIVPGMSAKEAAWLILKKR